MGNICRSPTAEGVFSALIMREKVAQQFIVESAGTHAYHIGNPPDIRAQEAAKNRNISLAHITARQVISADFTDFDYILVMDDDNYKILIQLCPDPLKNKIKYFLDFAPNIDSQNVPDPYYGGQYGFEKVLDMIEEAAIGFLVTLKQSGKIR